MFKFTSRTSAPIVYFDADAKRLLGAIGKDASAQGIITKEQIPAALAALEAAIAAEHEAAVPQSLAYQEPAPAKEGDGDEPPVPAVSLRQRAQPLLQLLRESQAAGDDVVWGV